MKPAEASVEELLIESGRSDARYWRDLWRYRELLGFLAWRDLKVRYKQAVLGIGWAVFQPLVTMAIFTFVFGRIAGMPAGGVPYEVLVLAGLLPWQLFSSALSGAGNSVVSNSHLISKVYFPRFLVPLSALAVALADFAIVLGLYAVVAVFFGVAPGWQIVFIPAFTLGVLLLALGGGLWLTSLTVKYRDFRFIVPFLLQVGAFVSPVGFRTDFYPNWQTLLSLNPMTGYISGFRWCVIGDGMPLDRVAVAYAMVLTLFLVVSGAWFFRKTERQFADVI